MPVWNALSAREVLQTASSRAGVRLDHLELLHFAKSAVYLLGREGIVARVSRPGVGLRQISAGIDLAGWLAGQGFPVVEPLPGRGPVEVDGSVVSFWRAEELSGQASPAQWGEMIRAFHRAGRNYPGQLPGFDPLGQARHDLRALERAGEQDGEDLEILWRWQAFLEKRAGSLKSSLGEGVLHGNASRDNSRLRFGGAFLLDLDAACRGPLEWDLVSETIGPRRFGQERSIYTGFSKSYGCDVTGWAGFSDLARARELLLTLFRLRAEQVQSSGTSESDRRLLYWRGERNPPLWKGF